MDNKEEQQYLNLINKVLTYGAERDDRTGIGTYSLFGETMRFSLSSHFPLLTTKRIFWRGVVEELLWFIRGDTNANHLKEKNIHIWDKNASREFLDSHGLQHREEGDLGPVYGFQWRHYGAEYVDYNKNYDGKGIDQLKQCIEKIKTNPSDRRIVMTAWNPSDIDKMALPPCHMFCQFYVNDEKLSCLMYQRSCDVGLGVPFNIASYSLLTYLVAHVCGLQPGEFVYMMGDVHIYKSHVDALKEQMKREMREFPKLRIRDTDGEYVRNIDNITTDNIILEDYNPHPVIKMDMAV